MCVRTRAFAAAGMGSAILGMLAGWCIREVSGVMTVIGRWSFETLRRDKVDFGLWSQELMEVNVTYVRYACLSLTPLLFKQTQGTENCCATESRTVEWITQQ